MPRCTHQGCGQEFDEAANAEGSCSYHPGGPVFHEGLKSWSCCSETNKPVLEFDAFMALPACTKGAHTTAPPPKPASASASASAAQGSAAPTVTVDQNGVETYGVAPKPASAPAATAPLAPTPAAPPKVEHEDDDPSASVPAGARCKRLACGESWAGEPDGQRGHGADGECRYHPQAAVFHEGSKGYLCCKRRVLEFDEFMRIEGCTTGRHLFVGPKRDETQEELVFCRIDHYQTPLQVHVSAFAKGADKARSSITFQPQNLVLDLYLPGNKRVQRTLTLYGPIDPATSSFRILGTKVDVVLQKPSPASWPLLELPTAGTELPPGYALTFGVSGRTGTVGGKEIVLAPEEMAKRQL